MPIKLEDIHQAQRLAHQLTGERRELLEFETNLQHHNGWRLEFRYPNPNPDAAQNKPHVLKQSSQHINLDPALEQAMVVIVTNAAREALRQRVLRTETELLTLGVDVGAGDRT